MDRLYPSRRSLNTPLQSVLPASSFPPVQSVLPASSFPPVQSVLPASSFPPVQSVLDAYTQHPEVATLDQVMLPYLGMEEILTLYRYNYEHTVGRRFETRQTLNTLAIRYKLPAATTFKQLLQAYDMQYATVRSYLYNNRSPKELLYQAALEGDIQAMYNQLKLYPELRKITIYNYARERAARGGHRAIINLLLELGADKGLTIIGAAEGGHLDLVKEEIAGARKDSFRRLSLATVAHSAAANNQREVLDYILSLKSTKPVLKGAMQGAGISGNIATIEYLVARGADDYAALVQGAVEGGHFDIFKQYYDTYGPGELYDTFRAAMNYRRLDVVRYLFERGVVDDVDLVEELEDIKLDYKNYVRQIDNPKKSPNELAELVWERDNTTPIIEYLERHGVTNGDYF